MGAFARTEGGHSIMRLSVVLLGLNREPPYRPELLAAAHERD